jgi:nuclear pore complex protein Nup155
MWVLQVERFASAYLLRTQAGGPDERRVRTRERMKSAKTAVGRW